MNKRQILKDNRFKQFYEKIENRRIYKKLNKPFKPLIITGPFIKNERPWYHSSFIDEMLKLGYFKYGGYDDYYRLNGVLIHFGDRYKGKKEIAICANKITKYGKPWIYFPKYYSEYLKHRKIKTKKVNNICWIGATHRARKKTPLAIYCDLNYDSKTKQLPYLKYLKLLASHQFCLCYPGFGPKCHREVEAMGLGTVPAITPGVCTNYYNELIENIHYIKINNINDIKTLKNINNKHYQQMSNNCLKWFNNNIPPNSAYNVTVECIKNF